MKRLFLTIIVLLCSVPALADVSVTLTVNAADNSLNTQYPDGTKPGSPSANLGTYHISIPASGIINTSENHTGSYGTVTRVGGSETAVQVDLVDLGTGTCTGGGVDYDAITTVTKTWADGESGNDNDAFASVTKNDIDGADCTIILGLNNATTDFDPTPGEVATITLNVDNTDGSSGGSGGGGPVGWDGDDTAFGHRIVGGVCPDIPTDAADHTVTTEGQLNTALAALDGVGGIIEISDGAYNWGDVTINASGADANNRIYIRSETYRGADLGNVRFDITGRFVTMSGYEFDGTASGFRHHILETADDLEIACIYMDNAGAAIPASVFRIDGITTNSVNDFELRDSSFLNFDAPTGQIFYFTDQCSLTDGNCVGMHKRHHIHHNHFKGEGSVTGNLSHPGSGISPGDEANPHPLVKDKADWLWENNHFEDWRGYNIHDLKSSGHIFRWNCFDNSRIPHFRKGHDMLYVGNWHFDAQGNEGWLGSGWEHVVAFNYFEFTSNRALFKFRIGVDDDEEPGISQGRWPYWSGSDGTYSYNVCDNCSAIVNELSNSLNYPVLADNNTVQGLSRDNTITNNKIRNSTGSFSPADFYSNDSQGYNSNAATFKAAQTAWTNNTVHGSPKNSTACFQTNFVDAHGDNTTTVPGKSTLPDFGGEVQTDDVIPAPSWWQ